MKENSYEYIDTPVEYYLRLEDGMIVKKQIYINEYGDTVENTIAVEKED